MQSHPSTQLNQDLSSAAQQTKTQEVSLPTYERPQLRDLGAWSSLTLVYSLPVGPGGYGSLPGTSQDC